MKKYIVKTEVPSTTTYTYVVQEESRDRAKQRVIQNQVGPHDSHTKLDFYKQKIISVHILEE